ncbi:hypothetical protein SUGI_0589820 [Cryptomeria japonica]|nr:hypothetical protein SUGI_0589820 [Cryptomeria japonica]
MTSNFNYHKWLGLMGSSNDYFENGNLDMFSGVGVCLNGPICSLLILSDGTGNKPGWFCDYVEITSTGSGTSCYKQKFVVDHWIAIDETPYQLSFSTNLCNNLFNATIVT